MQDEAKRVGLVRAVSGRVAVAQEINYPARQGAVIYRELANGLFERYEGTHERKVDELVPRGPSTCGQTRTTILRGRGRELGLCGAQGRRGLGVLSAPRRTLPRNQVDAACDSQVFS